MENNKEILKIGESFGSGLRETSQYDNTELAFITQGLIEAVLNQTPPVGLNLQILMEQMPEAMSQLKQLLPRDIKAALFGLAIVDGVHDTMKLINQIGEKNLAELNVVDIDRDIIDKVDALQEVKVKTFHQDAANTSLPTASLDLIIRDHLGNCCPPFMYQAIEKELARVLSEDGLSLVNITTSEKLLTSLGRRLISLSELETQIPSAVIEALKSRIFTLEQLKQEFPQLETKQLRGCLLEISPNSFVIFGEDQSGHCEWFSPLEWQISLWQENGFEVLDHHLREGQDSHHPALECQRHIVLLKKTGKE
jgi:hypothetical protein